MDVVEGVVTGLLGAAEDELLEKSRVKKFMGMARPLGGSAARFR